MWILLFFILFLPSVLEWFWSLGMTLLITWPMTLFPKKGRENSERTGMMCSRYGSWPPGHAPFNKNVTVLLSVTVLMMAGNADLLAAGAHLPQRTSSIPAGLVGCPQKQGTDTQRSGRLSVRSNTGARVIVRPAANHMTGIHKSYNPCKGGCL